MTEQSKSPPRQDTLTVPPERRFADELGLLGERSGMPRVAARVLGWLLICDPPAQSSAELAEALGLSRASVSIGTRLLEATGLVRRTLGPGARSYHFEVVPGALTSLRAEATYREWRQALERGLALLENPERARAARLRELRDFYAFVEREVPRLIERFHAERAGRQTPREPSS